MNGPKRSRLSRFLPSRREHREAAPNPVLPMRRRNGDGQGGNGGDGAKGQGAQGFARRGGGADRAQEPKRRPEGRGQPPSQLGQRPQKPGQQPEKPDQQQKRAQQRGRGHQQKRPGDEGRAQRQKRPQQPRAERPTATQRPAAANAAEGAQRKTPPAQRRKRRDGRGQPRHDAHGDHPSWAYSLQNRAGGGAVEPVPAVSAVSATLLSRGAPIPEMLPNQDLQVSGLLKKIGVEPANVALYEEAFTHTTYTNEHPEARSYERLEFLGDAIIGFLTARFLFEMSSDNEGAMSRDRIAMVQAKTLTRAAVELELGRYIRVGAGLRGQPVTAKMLEDCFEAFVGALYLDQSETAVKALLTRTIFRYYLNNDLHDAVDYKTRFQEYVRDAGGSHKLIGYRQERHNRRAGYFEATVAYAGKTLGSGMGPQLRDAEIDAARSACAELSRLSPKQRKKRLLGG